MTRDEAQKVFEAGQEATIRKLQELSAENNKSSEGIRNAREFGFTPGRGWLLPQIQRFLTL